MATDHRVARDGFRAHGPLRISAGRRHGYGESVRYLAMSPRRSTGAGTRETRVSAGGEGAAGLASRRAAIAMAAGGSMFVAPAITPIEQASTLYVVKILMSVAGFIVFCFGASLYLYVLVREPTEATVRLRRGSDGSSRRLRVREGPT